MAKHIKIRRTNMQGNNASNQGKNDMRSNKKRKGRKFFNKKSKEQKANSAGNNAQNSSVQSGANLKKDKSKMNAQQNVKNTADKHNKQEVDTGIKLITRRAPTQKYANFEEFMKSRMMKNIF